LTRSNRTNIEWPRWCLQEESDAHGRCRRRPRTRLAGFHPDKKSASERDGDKQLLATPTASPSRASRRPRDHNQRATPEQQPPPERRCSHRPGPPPWHPQGSHPRLSSETTSKSHDSGHPSHRNEHSFTIT
jgi:hypothetical protein